MSTRTGYVLMDKAGCYLQGNWMFSSDINNAVIVDKNRADFLLIKSPDLLILPVEQKCTIQVVK